MARAVARAAVAAAVLAYLAYTYPAEPRQLLEHPLAVAVAWAGAAAMAYAEPLSAPLAALVAAEEPSLWRGLAMAASAAYVMGVGWAAYAAPELAAAEAAKRRSPALAVYAAALWVTLWLIGARPRTPSVPEAAWAAVALVAAAVLRRHTALTAALSIAEPAAAVAAVPALAEALRRTRFWRRVGEDVYEIDLARAVPWAATATLVAATLASLAATAASPKPPIGVLLSAPPSGYTDSPLFAEWARALGKNYTVATGALTWRLGEGLYWDTTLPNGTEVARLLRWAGTNWTVLAVFRPVQDPRCGRIRWREVVEGAYIGVDGCGRRVVARVGPGYVALVGADMVVETSQDAAAILIPANRTIILTDLEAELRGVYGGEAEPAEQGILLRGSPWVRLDVNASGPAKPGEPYIKLTSLG